MLGAASDVGLDGTQMHYVTSYTAAELRAFDCERVCKMPLSGLDPSILIGFLCKTEAEWIDLRRRVAEVRSLDVVHDTHYVRDVVIQESQNDLLDRRRAAVMGGRR